MKVLITGAEGRIGTAIREQLDEDAFELTGLDIDPGDAEDTVEADVREYDSIRPHFDGQDAVIHLAIARGMGRPGTPTVGWSDTLADYLCGIHNVYEAAINAELDRILFASSNHAVGMVELRNAPEIYHDAGIRVGHDEPHRPDSLYGLTKCYGEDLGRFVAETHGLRFYALRFGAIRSEEYDHPFGDAERGVERGDWERGSDDYWEQVARMKGLWQSRRDAAHMVERCLLDESVEWDHFYGVSANDRRWLDDLDHARETIGYRPVHNGETWDHPPG